MASETNARPSGNSPDVALPPLSAPTDPQSGELPAPAPPAERVGFALVGLGQLTLAEVLPAFGRCEHARPVALVSGDAEKMSAVARQYGIRPESCYSYEDYDQIKDNPEVEVIYIVLPNAQHAEYTVRGARAGKHILCEKPMATSVAECEQMIAACAEAGKKLMIAYRIQYEPLNRQVQQLVRQKAYGRVKYLELMNGQNQADNGQWRLDKDLAGGGSLPDVGLYCLNTSRFLLGEEPVEVSATIQLNADDPRFAEVEDLVSFRLRFPSGAIASCASSYGVFNAKSYTVHAETGTVRMDPGFSYRGLRQERIHAPGGSQVREQPENPDKDQFALEMDHMAQCVRQNRTPYTPGEEGLQDQRIMDAIYLSARENRPVALPAVAGLDAFRGPAPEEQA
ncbi:Gfo/Idh/MocA family protein [uncultured Hymenobacter sp.]|uniref:Gfo/Idh/MocA family protein n=1 Tax=uncultured Hymenobacter sp. TaxID=170016 RepID=UPI0035C97DC1